MRNDDSYEAYKRKFNLGVVGVIILMLVLWFGNFDGSNHNWELLVKNIGTTKATYRQALSHLPQDTHLSSSTFICRKDTLLQSA